MLKNSSKLPHLEPVRPFSHHLLCWKSVLAGVLISLMAFMILTAFGAAVFGSTAENLIAKEKGEIALFTTTGVWLGISAAMSLFLGSYFAIRISNFVTNKVGAAHGFVIASIFFILMISMVGSAVGTISKGLGRIVQTAGESAAKVSASPQVQDAFDTAFGNSTLKSDPKEVAQGLLARLMEGREDSAKSYLAYQAGLSREEAASKIDRLKINIESAAKEAGERASAALADTGWSLLMTFLVGLTAALMGGHVAAASNVERPLVTKESEFVAARTPAII